jgi:hypothetical protein
MPDPAQAILAVLDRAIADSGLCAKLAADPMGTMSAEGVSLDGATLKNLLDIQGATDRELVEVLRARISNAAQGCYVPPK